ncbi:putative membrane protein [Aminobacter sp. J15]|nr:putative membrane protein [Aminobacter sp. J15]
MGSYLAGRNCVHVRVANVRKLRHSEPMLSDSQFLTRLDLVALAFFLLCWGVFSPGVIGRIISRPTLTSMMDGQRANWMRTMARRELRMVDTGIMSGLQQGTAFFASSCLLAIGGCFALFGSTDAFLEVLSEIPAPQIASRRAFEAKVFGLIGILSYGFFKFGWSYRLFNYCSILMGAVPSYRDDPALQPELDVAVRRATRMNVLAGRHFNEGLRAIFFALAYLGWFIGAWMLIATTVFIIFVEIRRQFFSAARDAVAE